jgi:energy-coupling factor transport system permease protein
MIHPLAWVVWLASVIAGVSVTRNPLYLVLLLLSINFVGWLVRQQLASLPPLVSPIRFTVWVVGFAGIFNMLTSHYGETDIFTIPGRIPFLSGPITLEALVYGFINGLVLAGLFSGFGVMVQAVPVRNLLRLVPRVFYPVAVVVSIAVTYIPATLRQFRQIQEAQAVRGHQVRGLRDWVPLLLPLLIGGLERALALAEAMTARGFASPVQGESTIHPRLTLLAGLAMLLTGWIFQWVGWRQLGWLVMLIGAALLIGGFWLLGRKSTHTIYRQDPWCHRDWLVCLTSGGFLAIFWLPGFASFEPGYEPYPQILLPTFNVWIGLAILCILVPGLIISNQLKKDQTEGN